MGQSGESGGELRDGVSSRRTPRRGTRVEPTAVNEAMSRMRTTRWVLALVRSAVALGTVAWLVTSVNELHDRLARHSEPLALVFVGTASFVALASALTAVRMFWKLGHTPRAPDQVKAPEDIVRAAVVQADKAEMVINQVKDESARAELGGELAAIRADGVRRRFRVVVFGTGSA